MRVRWIFLFLLLSVFVLPRTASAMRLAPDSSDVIVDFLHPITAKIIVENDEKDEENYRVRFQEVLFGEDANDLTFADVSPEFKKNLSVNAESFTLNSGEKRELEVTLDIPKSEHGSKAIAVMVEEVHEGEGIAVTSAAASLLFLHMGEGLEAQMRVLEWKASPPWSTNGMVNLSLVVRNEGNDTRTFEPEIVVKNMFGSVVDRFPLSEREKRIPIEKTRSFSLVWPRENGFHGLLFGQYTFTLVMGETTLGSASAGFLPIPIAIVFGLVLLFLVLGILMRVRKAR